MLAVDLQTVKAASRCALPGRSRTPASMPWSSSISRPRPIAIDDVLKNAMPPDVRKVVDQFNPSGVVKAHAKVFRKPLPGRPDRPEGLITIDAEIDLTERCEITWEGCRTRFAI